MKIGVTGNYASGKGTVCSFFEELGGIVIDTDIVSREVVVPGSPVLAKIIDTFGKQFLLPNGSLNRRELGKHVFISKERVDLLHSIIHPAIIQSVLEQTEKAPNRTYIINAPVLFEAGMNTQMDAVIVVKSSIEQSISRGIIRDGLSIEEIQNRINNQISLNQKEKSADYCIDNSGTLDSTKKQVVEIWNSIHKTKHAP